MASKEIIKYIFLLVIIASNIGCDRISKNIVRNEIAYNETLKFLGNHFTLTKVENTGAFLSLGNSLPEKLRIILLIVLPILVMALAFIYFLKNRSISKWILIGLSFVIGGGIGNLYDRVMHGSVTDFMHINFVIFQTGIFNMADVSIMAGMFMILIHLVLKQKLNATILSDTKI